MANSYLSHSQSAGNRTNWTLSAWVKRSALGTAQYIMANYSGSNYCYLQINPDNKMRFLDYSSGNNCNKITTRVFRDTSSWYHVVIAIDTTDSTAEDRFKLYINGVRETAFDTSANFSSSFNTNMNVSGHTSVFGVNQEGNASYWNGYMSHVALVDGATLAPTVFGETDSTSGIWKFKSPSTTWGTNGVHLKFENSAALGTDSSGQSNTYTVNGNLKQALDTPSNVYCTMNPLSTTQNFNLSNGNNTFGAAADNKYITGNLGGDSEAASTGYYFEYKVNANNLGNSGEGFRVGVKSVENIFASDNDWYGLQETASDLIYEKTNGSSTTDTNIGSASNGDVVMIAWGKGGKIWMGVNGVWVDSGNPSSGSGEQYSGLTGVYAPFIMCSLTNGMNGSSMNFGNGFFGTTAITSAGSNGNGSLFEYDVPSGFYALNTKNINTYG